MLRHGYPTVVHKQKIYRVHWLVAIAFLGPPPSAKHTVDHIEKYDGNWKRARADNRVENLRWATKSEQRRHQDSSATRVDKQNNEKPWYGEEFRSVEGIEVSLYGRTRNRRRNLHAFPNKSMEYASVGTTRKPLHVLVAKAFPEIVGLPGESKYSRPHQSCERGQQGNKSALGNIVRTAAEHNASGKPQHAQKHERIGRRACTGRF